MLYAGLRNPREHGSGAPRKRIRMAEKVRRILERKNKQTNKTKQKLRRKERTQNADFVP